MPNLVPGKQTASYLGAAELWTATSTGVLKVKAWGGAGGGGSCGGLANTVGQGGGGGYIYFEVDVVKNDIIKVEVGGGAGGGNPYANAGGVGGWPDGGGGGYASGYYNTAGGGGGSTRIYKNNVLIGVAGAGGGGAGRASTANPPTNTGGGGGGGLTGQNVERAAGGVPFSTGGTQTTGGINNSNTQSPNSQNGASLLGGNGFSAGFSRTRGGDGGQNVCGGGGGGGYYGGAGGGDYFQLFGLGNQVPGAGGSSFIAATSDVKNGVLTQATSQQPANAADADRPTNAGLGANSGGEVAPGGNHGAVVMEAPMANVSAKDVILSTGAPISYSAPSAGVVEFKLWGGGGGGGSFYSGMADTSPPGGAGGLTTGRIVVAAGDIIKIEAARGGEQSTPALARGGFGGYPDGGNGGFANATNPGACFGGGGGSTRIYKNNVLMAVAGGGGGNGWAQPYGGPGGGLTGGTEGSAAAGTGGTQTTGGNFGGANLLGGSSRAARDFSGGGGGGGWYGGGSSTGLYGPGGGGSSWVHASVLGAALLQGVQGTPPVDADRPAGVAAGGLGQNYTNGKVPTKGGDGAAQLKFAPALTEGNNTSAPYTGAAQSFSVVSDVAVEFKLWAGAGGGSIVHPDTVQVNYRAGGGGYTYGLFPASAGDVIKIETGQGGPKNSTVANSVLGGWPDGGTGGKYSNGFYGGGGGGGSTRIYLNNVLVAVAGAGGGAMRGTSGSGGGLSGGTAIDVFGGNAQGATGGTQTAPGGPILGGYLQGGNGGGLPEGGGGGGGGYYGGGASSAVVKGGGGGSGWVNPSYVVGGLLEGAPQGSTGAAARTADSHYPGAPIARGGVSNVGVAANVTDGGDGFARAEVKPKTVLNAYPATIAPNGSEVTKVMDTAGLLQVRLWGGGGGGASSLGGTPKGGSGGFTDITMRVTTGDVLKFQVGLGGKKGVGAVSAAGGYPDGGASGAPFNGSAGNGGGGGSSRVYLNGVLMGIAGGGGGSGASDSNGVPGAGGGTAGQAGLTPRTSDSTPTGAGTAGSQTAGGVNSFTPATAGYNGAFMQGGKGSAGAVGTPSDANGAGGGGGYYGGGGAGRAGGYYSGGGGGSGYLNTASTAYVAGTTATGAREVPPGTTNPIYPGSQIGYGATGANDGFNGAIIYTITPTAAGSVGTITLTPPEGNPFSQGSEIRFAYTGTDQQFTAPRTGTLIVRAWGGGGGSGYNLKGSNKNGAGASGGYIYTHIAVNAGDVIKVKVGGGGGGAGSAGGAGGWPNGGAGVNSGNSGSDIFYAGGGGGSTAIYVNDVLQAVAGAAGGGWGPYTAVPDQIRAGAGGGLTGGSGYNRANQLSTGGTQTAGGTNPNNPTSGAGGFLQGGSTYGAGGGGGYYGGAGGYPGGGATFAGGAGGGSSYIGGPLVTYGLTRAGTYDAGDPGGFSDAKYPGNNVGRGGLNSSTDPSSPGGNGAVHVTFEGQTPALAEGGATTDIVLTAPIGGGGTPASISMAMPGPVTLVSPTGGVIIGKPEGLLGTVALFAPTGKVEADVAATGNIGAIGLFFEATNGATAEALIQIPFQDAPIFVSYEGNELATGDHNIRRPFPGPIFLTAPKGSIQGYTTTEPFANDITLTTPLGFAQDGIDVPTTAIPPITLTAPTIVPGDVGGGVRIWTINYQNGQNDTPYFVSINLQMGLVGTVTTGSVSQNLPFPGPIVLTEPTGFSEEGVEVTGPIDQDIFLSVTPPPPNGAPPGDPPWPDYARGSANAYSLQNSYSDNSPSSNFLSRISLDNFMQATLVAEQNFTTPVEDIEIKLTAPSGTARYEVTILASILPTMIYLRPGQGFAGPENAGIASGNMDNAVISLIEPHSYVDSDQPGFAPLRYWRTKVSGRAPTSLEPREIAINEADGTLYTANADGEVIATALLAMQRGDIMPSEADDGYLLRGDGVWGQALPLYDQPVRNVLPVARVVLADRGLNPGIVGAPSTEVQFQPFFIPKTTTLKNFGATVSFAAAGAARLFIMRWTLPNILGEVLLEGAIDTSVPGPKTIAGELTLKPGWYTAAFSYTGSPSTTFEATRTPVTIGPAFNTLGPLKIAAVPAGTPGSTWADVLPLTEHAAASYAYITAEHADA